MALHTWQSNAGEILTKNGGLFYLARPSTAEGAPTPPPKEIDIRAAARWLKVNDLG